jgi:DsbE subfamily thiol:disulfide oxidoreductase
MQNFKVLALGAILLFSISGHAAKKVDVGTSFPEFSLNDIRSGKPMKLAALRGKVTIIDFWASWCEPCKKELPFLDALSKSHKSKGLNVIGVNVDDDKKDALEFLKKVPVAFVVVHDAGKKLVETIGIPTMPTSFVVDAKGKVRFKHAGFSDKDPELIKKEVETLLK